MKSVLISIQPYYVFLIIARLMGWDIPQEKTIEVRKDFPKDNAWNKVVYIYCGKNRKSFNRIPAQYQSFMARLLGKVVGEFVCNKVEKLEWNKSGYGLLDEERIIEQSCVEEKELYHYLQGAGYGWHISDLKIYDTPKELGEFNKRCIPQGRTCRKCKYLDGAKDSLVGICTASLKKPLTIPPQSWGYVEG